MRLSDVLEDGGAFTYFYDVFYNSRSSLSRRDADSKPTGGEMHIHSWVCCVGPKWRSILIDKLVLFRVTFVRESAQA